MASTSSPTSQWIYDVFISFRGADVRDGFLSHLFDALSRKQIVTFKDENLGRGENISPSLLKAIEESYAALVIFSENYANSPWCLDELVKIVNCKKSMGQTVIPIFYHVDPTDVQELKGSFGEGFKGLLGEEFKDKMESWMNALRETAEIAGFNSQNLQTESKLINEIVEHVSKRINHAFSYVLNDDGLIGIDTRVNDVESKLCTDSSDVRFIGIWGMGGIGKTTIASKIFDKISSEFESKCFVFNVREKAERYKLDYLQREILSELFGTEVSNQGRPIMLCASRNWLMRKKVLIVLDDVSEMEQIEFLIGKHDLYSPGSRVIMTSRDKQLLNNGGVDEIYEVKELNHCEALQLLSLHAFKRKSPAEEYIKLAEKAVECAKGIPLALKVLGSTLHNKNIREWEDQLEKLEAMVDKRIQKILKISYDELDYMEKEIFLDIACFFKGENKDDAESILLSSGLNARIGISRLLDKALITISGNKLEMHDLLQQMGRGIVCEESINEPWRRSRLWIPRDVYDVLTKDLEELAVKSIHLDLSKIGTVKISSGIFKRMKRLRFLKFYNPYFPHEERSDSCNGAIKVHQQGGLTFLPEELRYLYWIQYPSECLPPKFFPNNLVQLHLIRSQMKKVCRKNQFFENLKFMDLSYSVKLIKIPDLSRLPKLEVLCLRGCIRLVKVRSTGRYGSKLRHVDLEGCINICCCSSFLHMECLEFLSLENCSRIREFPKLPGSIKCLILNKTAIKQVPSSIEHFSHLVTLKMTSCTMVRTLPCNIGELKFLEELNLEGCRELMDLPDSICNLKFLKNLHLRRCTNLKGLPENLGNLESLEMLDATKSGVKGLPFSINSLSKLTFLRCGGCKDLMLPLFTGLISLKGLYLEECGLSQISDSLGSLKSLCYLNLHGNTFEMLPVTIKQLSELTELFVGDNKRLKYIPEVPSTLQHMSVQNCINLESISFPKGLRVLNAHDCIKLDHSTREYILEDVLLRAKNMLSYLRAYDFHRFPHRVNKSEMGAAAAIAFGVSIPGGELPPWVTYQNNKGTNVFISNFVSGPLDYIAMVCCAVVASEDFRFESESPRCTSCFVTESGRAFRWNSNWPEFYSRSIQVPRSENILFWLSKVSFSHKHKFIKASLQFFPEGGNTMVKKCGFCLLPSQE